MTTHRYERGAILADYARGGVGLAVFSVPLIATPLATTLTVIFSGLSALFGVYVIRTWLRSAQAIEVDGDGIRRSGPMSITIPWSELKTFEIRYFSTRRDKTGGWMEMKITAEGSKLAVESSIDDFEAVVRHCMLVAQRNGLELSPTTQDNLRALGLLGPSEDGNDGDGGQPAQDPRIGGPGFGPGGGRIR